jgi:hypothetical protein
MPSHRWVVLPLALASIAGLLPPAPADEKPGEVTRLHVTVTESAGIRRFSYPVHVALPLKEALLDKTTFRLLEDGKPVAAQFREEGRSLHLDFTANHAPRETRNYVVEYGQGVPAGPEPKGGVKVETADDTVTVSHSSALEFELPRDALGLLRQVRSGKTEYLRPGSPGLWIRYKDHIHFRAGGFGPDGVPTVSRATRTGPFAAALRFEGTEALRGGRSVSSVVEMEFPRSKSWVYVNWTVADANGLVAGLGAELYLNVQGEPTLVDFGAGSYVYAPLRSGQSARMRAGFLGRTPPADAPLWETLVGPAAALKPYVVAPADERASPAEGWMHVMDRTRCTAVAVADFAAPGQESEMTIDADGRLQIWRSFSPGDGVAPRGPKRLSFWLHFVGMPVHVGAATSPQSMLAPLRVEVRPE